MIFFLLQIYFIWINYQHIGCPIDIDENSFCIFLLLFFFIIIIVLCCCLPRLCWTRQDTIYNANDANVFFSFFFLIYSWCFFLSLRRAPFFNAAAAATITDEHKKNREHDGLRTNGKRTVGPCGWAADSNLIAVAVQRQSSTQSAESRRGSVWLTADGLSVCVRETKTLTCCRARGCSLHATYVTYMARIHMPRHTHAYTIHARSCSIGEWCDARAPLDVAL